MKIAHASSPRLFAAFLLCAGVSLNCFGDDKPVERKFEPSSASDAAQNKPDGEKEKTPPIKISGVFEAVQSSELRIDNEELTELEIQRILPHGQAVKSGQAVVWFATKPLDQKMVEAETDFKIAKLDMDSAEFTYEQFQETQKLDRAAAKRKRDEAQQDYDHFVKVQLERDIANAEQSMKSAEFSVESSREELEQLTQMYEEDDLTEASEEIVMRRAKFSYESAMHRLTDAKIRIRRTLDQTIPRTELSSKETLDRARLTYDKAIHELNVQQNKQRLEIERKRRGFEKEKKTYEDMRAERKEVVLKAAHDGIVLHGALNRGKVPAKQAQWDKGKKVSKGTVIATVANPAKLRVRIDLPEDTLSEISKGKRATVVPTGHPGMKLKGKIVSIGNVPYVPGKFDCVVALTVPQDKGLNPAMTCNVQVEKDVE